MSTRRVTNRIEEDVPSRLLVPREEARQKINTQIEKGKSILNINASTEDDVKVVKTSYKQWNDFNEELLNVLFSGNKVVKDYRRHTFISYTMGGGLRELLRVNKELTQKAITELESLEQRLDLFLEPGIGTVSNAPETKFVPSNDVFIVHGHDEGLKQTVARLLMVLDLKPIILHEQPNEGNTIIEKFENFSNTKFVVVLLTPDDKGGTIDSDSFSPRARQNVIFELGYFFGKMGRKSVCALYTEGIDLPSDISGIVYIPLDKDGAWKFKLAKEMKASGLQVDLNKLD